MKIMPFPVDEQSASIARLDLSPIVSTHRGFQQDRSAILQLGLANIMQLVSMDKKKMFSSIAHLDITFLQQSFKVVVKQCVEKLDV